MARNKQGVFFIASVSQNHSHLKGVCLKRQQVLATDGSTDPQDHKTPEQLTEALGWGLCDTGGQVKGPVLVFTAGGWQCCWHPQDDMRFTNIRVAWAQSLAGKAQHGLICECSMFLQNHSST